MKNTLTDLNNYLFEALERLLDDEATGTHLEREVLRTEAITKIAQSVIATGSLALKAMNYVDDPSNRRPLPPMLDVGKLNETV